MQEFHFACLVFLVLGFAATWCQISMSGVFTGYSPVQYFVGLLFLWIFLIPLSCFACSNFEWPCFRSHAKLTRERGQSFRFGRALQACLFAVVVRYGEARHPGPGGMFRLGIFNPSGLTSKTGVLSELPGDVWFGSETHLTSDGVRRLRTGLKALQSEYAYVVPGAPCGSTRSRAFGERAGVVAVSKFPARPLPHAFPPDVFASSRVQVVGVSVGPLWLQVGIVYGFPDSRQHLERTFRTETLLDAVIDRVALQADGPRVICGDLNHSSDQLAALDRLKSLGFREIQDVAASRWGHVVCPTSKGPYVIDQMWLSPEMQSLVCGLNVYEDHWADHFSVEAQFRVDLSVLSSARWHMPAPFPWPSRWSCAVSCDWAHPSLAYASLWHQLEQAGSQCGVVPSKKAFGRGQTLHPELQYRQVAPCRFGRSGTDQPGYFGESLLHVRWFRQLRRIQALCRMLHSSSCSQIHHVKMCEVWKAIRNAHGFGSGFCWWWASRYPTFPKLTFILPLSSVVDQLLDGFRKEVRVLERQLQAIRFQRAKTDRCSQPNLIFKDCARDAPEVLDTLVHEVVAEVVDVQEEDSVVTLEPAPAIDVGMSLVVQGIPRVVQSMDGNAFHLSRVDGICVGDQARHQVVHTSDHAIMEEFARVWKPRWNKLEHVADGQWEQITSFCSRTFGPIQWHFQPITPTRLSTAFRHKKRKSSHWPRWCVTS